MAFNAFPIPTTLTASLTGTLFFGTSIKLNMDTNLAGTATGQVNRNLISVGSEQVKAPQGALVNLLTLNYNCGGNAATGAFNTLECIMNLNGATGNASGSYVSGTFIAQGTVPDGGALFGLNPNVRLTNGATGWLQLIGSEIDLAAQTGSSVQDKIGEQIVQTTADTVNGSRSNIGHLLGNQAAAGSGTVGWDVGYCFGAYSGYNPIKSTGTLIGFWQHANASGPGGAAGSMGTVQNGVDLRGYTFNGAPVLAQLQTPASSSATGTTGSICWDGSFIYVCTATNTWKRATLASF